MHCIKYTSKLTGQAVESVRAISNSNTDQASLYHHHIFTHGGNLQVPVALCKQGFHLILTAKVMQHRK